jgi:2-amino-4-hydroxy-6-hydroxymethyldihydropteridine diphosphokinase
LFQIPLIVFVWRLAVIVVGIGANLPGEGYADTWETCEAALVRLPVHGIEIEAVSPWYESEPVPRSEQPWYLNAVIRVGGGLSPGDLLGALHDVEAEFGRERGAPNAARPLDLDLLDHNGLLSAPDAWPILPHPRLHARAFVLLPLRDLAPTWRHPRLGVSIDSLISGLPEGQGIRRRGG